MSYRVPHSAAGSTGADDLILANDSNWNIASWNPVISWLRRIERLKFAE
jgi:hypothetical protein